MTRASFLVAFPVLVVAGCARQQHFVRDHPDDAKLTPAQERTIVELARTVGVVDIETVAVRWLWFPDWKQILVKEREAVKGRRVAYRWIEIGYAPWTPKRHWPPTHVPLVEGFWVEGTRWCGCTILNALGREYRVALARQFSIEEAERLVSTFLPALERGSFELARPVDRRNLGRVLSQLANMDLDLVRRDETENAYGIGFGFKDGNGGHVIVFTVEGERIKILEVHTGCE